LNLIENHQSIVSEEIYQSLHSRDGAKMRKDSNNNNATAAATTITTTTNTSLSTSTKVKSKIDKTTTIQKPVDIINSMAGKSVKIVENKSGDMIPSQLQSGTNTLKRKRETKSPTKYSQADSTTSEMSKKQQQQEPEQEHQQQQQTSPTVATILVSKTKSKSGLPLLLKK
jgi:hypothetical protein